MDADFGGRTEALAKQDGTGVASAVLRAVEAALDRLTLPLIPRPAETVRSSSLMRLNARIAVRVLLKMNGKSAAMKTEECYWAWHTDSVTVLTLRRFSVKRSPVLTPIGEKP